MNVEQKLGEVAQHPLCYNCLAQSHGRADCKSIDRCHRCLQDHHTWLHALAAGHIWFSMTATVKVLPRRNGSELYIRALIDPTAARSSVIKYKTDDLQCDVKKGRTIMSLFPERSNVQPVDIEFVVENKIYGHTPSAQIKRENYDITDHKNRENADVHWYMTRRYQLVLGADIMSKVLIGPAKIRSGQIYVQETIFGLVHFGDSIV